MALRGLLALLFLVVACGDSGPGEPFVGTGGTAGVGGAGGAGGSGLAGLVPADCTKVEVYETLLDDGSTAVSTETYTGGPPGDYVIVMCSAVKEIDGVPTAEPKPCGPPIEFTLMGGDADLNPGFLCESVYEITDTDGNVLYSEVTTATIYVLSSPE